MAERGAVGDGVARAQAGDQAPSHPQSADGTALLEVRAVSKLFGPFRALDQVTLEVARGEVLGLVGPNGSGKTTLINLISGLLAPSSGQILFAGERVSGRPPYRLARLGINRTFQVPKPFASLTVEQNLRVAARVGARRSARTAHEILQTVGLAGGEQRLASELPAAGQKRLDLARALATGPRLLLIDELGAGLSTSELEELARVLRALAVDWGVTLVVVEHLLGFLERLTDRVAVLAAGQVIYSGSLTGALGDQTVIRTFIGG